MARLVEHVMINKLEDDLDSAITFVGGDTSNVNNIMQYPSIIREQLTANGSTNCDMLAIVQSCSGIIRSDSNGCDIFDTPYGRIIKDALDPNELYIRICVLNKISKSAEDVNPIYPIYIDLTLLFDDIKMGDIDIDEVVSRIISSNEIKAAIRDEVNKTLNDYALKTDLKDIEDRVSALENQEEPTPGMTEDEINELISNILKNYAKSDDLKELEDKVSALESKEDKVGITTGEAQALIDDSLKSYTTTEDLENGYVVKSEYETQYNTISEKIVELEQTSTNVTEVLQPQISVIENTLKEKLDTAQVEAIVIDKLNELKDDEGINMDELTW